MRFSIVVPIYNKEKYLKQCVESLVNQDFDDYEIILVDDGSTDDSANICDKMLKLCNKIKVFHKKNTGLVNTRKFGASKAVGDYIVSVDSDDFVTNDFLTVLNNSIIQSHSDCICFGYVEVNENGEFIKKQYNRTDSGCYEQQKLELLRKNWLYDSQKKYINYGQLIYGVCLKAVKRDCYIKSQNAVPDYIGVGEDTVFTSFLLNRVSSVFIINETPYMYRVFRQSMVRTFDETSFKNLLQVYRCIKENDSFGYNEKQLGVYCLHRFWNISMLCAATTNRYCVFKDIMERNYSLFQYEIEKIHFAKFTSSIKTNVIKHKMWWLLFYYSKIRGVYDP